jgi:hypothetical protein
LEILETGLQTGCAKEGDGILGILVEIRVKDPLVHEIGFALDGKEYPPQVVKLGRREAIRCLRNRRLDALCILVKDILAAGLYLRQNAESIVCR